MAYPLEYGDSPDTAAFNALNPGTHTTCSVPLGGRDGPLCGAAAQHLVRGRSLPSYYVCCQHAPGRHHSAPQCWLNR